MGLSAALARPSSARVAQRVVYCSCAVIKHNLSAREQNGSMAESPAIRTAMVLAAGLGTRMRPFNGKLPKPLGQVGGNALTDYVLYRLAEQGVEGEFVNGPYRADQFEQ